MGAGWERMAGGAGALGLSFAPADRPLHPRQQAQVLLCRGHGVRGQEAWTACVSLPAPGEQRLLTTCQEAGWRDPHPGVLPLPQLSPQDWEVQYQQDTPVAPRFDINAPDLYIPGCPLPPLPGHVWDRCLGAWCKKGFPPLTSVCVCLLQPWRSSPISWWPALLWGPRTGKGPGAGEHMGI